MTTKRIKRFTPMQRLFHVTLMLSFLIQAATGLARMCIETGWGQSLAGWFGGYAGALAIHKGVGLFMLGLFAVHLLYLLIAVPSSRWFGKDSMVPTGNDAKQMGRHIGWFLGLAREPAFGRFSYWEKFDYWAVFWGMVIIGGTGLMLYDPVATSRDMHGWSLNLALWVHRIEALLAIGHVFIIHFFAAHLRRRNFPMDQAMFLGSVDAHHARQERGPWVAEMEAAEAVAAQPSSLARTLSYLVGLAAVAAGILLLVGAIANLPNVTW